jgi:hypothetical protein
LVILLHSGHQDAGKVLILCAAVFMVLSSLVLLVSIRAGAEPAEGHRDVRRVRAGSARPEGAHRAPL